MANGFVTSRPAARAGSDTSGWPIDNSGYVAAQKFVAPGSGTLSVSEIGLWMNNNGSGAAARLAIFTHDAANDCPESMVSGSESATLTEATSTVTVHYSTLSSCSITGGQTYWIVGFNGGSVGFDQRTTTGAGFKGIRGATPYTWPTGAAWHSYDDSDTTIELGFYAVYSSGGGSSAPEVNGIATSAEINGVANTVNIDGIGS